MSGAHWRANLGEPRANQAHRLRKSWCRTSVISTHPIPPLRPGSASFALQCVSLFFKCIFVFWLSLWGGCPHPPCRQLDQQIGGWGHPPHNKNSSSFNQLFRSHSAKTQRCRFLRLTSYASRLTSSNPSRRSALLSRRSFSTLGTRRSTLLPCYPLIPPYSRHSALGAPCLLHQGLRGGDD
jgi:hypothetical protein